MGDGADQSGLADASVEAGKVLLAHADRTWKAEEVNAARLATKSNLLAAGTTAILGFAVLTVRRLTEVVEGRIWIVAGVLLLGTLVCLIRAIWLIVRGGLSLARSSPDPVPPISASGHLHLSEVLQDSAHEVNEQQAVWLSYRTTQRAAVDLRLRNDDRNDRLLRAERSLLYGVSFLVLLMILEIALAAQGPSTISFVGGNYGSNAVRQQP